MGGVQVLDLTLILKQQITLILLIASIYAVGLSAVASSSTSGSGLSGGSGDALSTVDEFSPAAVSTLLSEEMREAVVSTAYLALGKREKTKFSP